MAIKTAGSLGALIVAEETAFGVTPSTGWKYLGMMNGLDTTDDPNAETIPSDGSRVYSDVIFTSRECKFSSELSIFRDQLPYKWDHLTELAMGSKSGFTDDIPSFSALMKIASDQFLLAKGCKIDTLSLSAKGVGKQVGANISVICQEMSEQEASRIALVPGFTEPVIPTSPPVTYTSYPICTIPGLPYIPSTSFDLKISNKMTAKEGFVHSEALLAGSGIVPGEVEIELDLNVMSVSKLYDTLKRNGTKEFQVSLKLNDTLFTLKNCHLPGSDQPSRSQGNYDEGIVIKAADIIVTE